MSNIDCDKLCHENQEHRYEIVELREKIIQLENAIKNNEKIIWNNCEHDWVYDMSCGPYERNKYYCKKCRLWRNSYMY
jgi:hypothetical protein